MPPRPCAGAAASAPPSVPPDVAGPDPSFLPPCGPPLAALTQAGGGPRSSPVATARAWRPRLDFPASRLHWSRATGVLTAACLFPRHAWRTRRSVSSSALPCLREAAASRRRASLSTGQSQSPALSSAHRACLDERAESPLPRTDRPGWSALDRRAWLFGTARRWSSRACETLHPRPEQHRCRRGRRQQLLRWGRTASASPSSTHEPTRATSDARTRCGATARCLLHTPGIGPGG
jgi:hypothetical protein